MAKFKVFHQVTIDEYIASQEELFPDTPSVLAASRSVGPARRVSSSAPVFPGAVDGIGAAPGLVAPVQAVRSFGRKKMSG